MQNGNGRGGRESRDTQALLSPDRRHSRNVVDVSDTYSCHTMSSTKSGSGRHVPRMGTRVDSANSRLYPLSPMASLQRNLSEKKKLNGDGVDKTSTSADHNIYANDASEDALQQLKVEELSRSPRRRDLAPESSFDSNKEAADSKANVKKNEQCKDIQTSPTNNQSNAANFLNGACNPSENVSDKTAIHVLTSNSQLHSMDCSDSVSNCVVSDSFTNRSVEPAVTLSKNEQAGSISTAALGKIGQLGPLSALDARLMSIYENCRQARRSYANVNVSPENRAVVSEKIIIDRRVNNQRKAVSNNHEGNEDVIWTQMPEMYHNYGADGKPKRSSTQEFSHSNHHCETDACRNDSGIDVGQFNGNGLARRPTSLATKSPYNHHKAASKSRSAENTDDGECMEFSMHQSSRMMSHSSCLLPSRVRCYGEELCSANELRLKEINSFVAHHKDSKASKYIGDNGKQFMIMNGEHDSAPIPPPRNSSQGRDTGKEVVGRNSMENRSKREKAEAILKEKLLRQEANLNNGYANRQASEEREVTRKQLREKIRRERAQQLAEERKDLTTDDDGETTNVRRHYGRRNRAMHYNVAQLSENVSGHVGKKDASGFARLARMLMSSSSSSRIDNQHHVAGTRNIRKVSSNRDESIRYDSIAAHS